MPNSDHPQTADSPPEERPVFVFGCCWRTGSTLLQRVLTSHPDIHIWGEGHHTLSERLQSSTKALKAWTQKFSHNRDAFRRDGSQAWIANMCPEIHWIHQGLRSLYLSYYGASARAESGARRWGFKVVEHDAQDARYLLELFPKGRILFVVRNPVEVMISLTSMEWYWTRLTASEMVDNWCRIVESFSELDDPRVLKLHFESLIENPPEELAKIAEHLEVGPGEFDRSVFEHKRRGTNEEISRVGPRELWRFRNKRLVRLATVEGYDIRSDRRMYGFRAWVRALWRPVGAWLFSKLHDSYLFVKRWTPWLASPLRRLRKPLEKLLLRSDDEK